MDVPRGPGNVILCVARTGYHTLIIFTDSENEIVAKVEYAYPSPGYEIVTMNERNKQRIIDCEQTPVVWRMDDKAFVPDDEQVATVFPLSDLKGAIDRSWQVAADFDDDRSGYNLLTRNCRTFAMTILVDGCGVDAQKGHDAATANGFRFGVCTSGRWCPESCPFRGMSPVSIAVDIFSPASTGLLVNEVHAGLLRLIQALAHSLVWSAPAIALTPTTIDTCVSLARLKQNHGPRHKKRKRHSGASSHATPQPPRPTF